MLPFLNLSEVERFSENPRNAVAGQFSCLLADVAVIRRMLHARWSGCHPYAVAGLPCVRCEGEIDAGSIRTCDGIMHLSCWREWQAAEDERRAWQAECEDTEGRPYEQYVASLRDRVPLKRAAGSEANTNFEKGRVA